MSLFILGRPVRLSVDLEAVRVRVIPSAQPSTSRATVRLAPAGMCRHCDAARRLQWRRVRVGTTGDIIFSHTDHWHGFPVVSVGSQRQLRIHFVKQGRAADDHDMPPRNEWFTLHSHADHSLPVVIEDPTRARCSGDRLGGVLAGEAPGASRMSIRVFRGGTTVWEAPPLNLVVR